MNIFVGYNGTRIMLGSVAMLKMMGYTHGKPVPLSEFLTLSVMGDNPPEEKYRDESSVTLCGIPMVNDTRC